MSNSSANSRPVSWVSVAAILGCFALFLLIVYIAYVPQQPGAIVDDGVKTPEERKKILVELRANEASRVDSYAWVDQQAGVVQLPIKRAMELTVQKYSTGK